MASRKAKVFIAICVVGMLCASILPDVPLVGYLDEIAALLMGFAIAVRLMARPVRTQNVIPALMIIVSVAIGLLSNLFSGVARTPTEVVLDVLSYSKMFLVLGGVYILFEDDGDALTSFVSVIAGFSKVFIIAGFVCGVATYAGLLPLYDQVRYNLPCYAFIFGNATQYGILVGVALHSVLMTDDRNQKLYSGIGVLTLLMTLKGSSLIIASVYVILRLCKVRRVRVAHVLTLVGALGIVLSFQITNYLLNDAAPRSIFIRYGIITANKFFPLGAGFGTFGSEMAARNYSPLYYTYGFEDIKAMQPELGYLNDAYLGMLLGELGWIATALTVLFFMLVGMRLLPTTDEHVTAYRLTIGLYVCFLGMTVMAGSVKMAPSQLILVAIEIYLLRTQCSGDRGVWYGKRT